MEMMEGYQGGNASAQMLSSLICTDNNKESFFRWGFDIFAFGFIAELAQDFCLGYICIVAFHIRR